MDKKISQLNEVTVPEGTDVIAIVNNGETKKIKVENIGEFINKPLGWGRYDDSQWTEVSPLPLVDGVSVILSNNASNTIEEGDFSFFDSTTQKVKAQNVNDTYSITIVFKAKTSNANQTHLEVDFYSPVGDFDRLSQGVVFYKGNDIEQNEHLMAQYYSDSDLVSNGMEVKITSVGGSAEVYDIIFFIQRVQNNG